MKATHQSLHEDIASIRQRLAGAYAATKEAQPLSQGAADQILTERARRLARPHEKARATSETIGVLTFALGNEQYGIETRYAREVLRLTNFTPVPGGTDFIVGITNFRGELLIVFDLQRVFDLPSRGLTDRSQVIVCGEAEPEFGLVADAAGEVVSLSVDEFAGDTALADERERNCVRGVTRTALIVLDGAALLSDRRLFIGQ